MPADPLPAIRARLAALPPDLRAEVQHLHRGQLVTVTDGAESVVVLADTYCGAVHGHGGPIAEALAGLPGDAAWLAGEVERLRAERDAYQSQCEAADALGSEPSCPAGHPGAALASSPEGTTWCRWCEDVARLRRDNATARDLAATVGVYGHDLDNGPAGLVRGLVEELAEVRAELAAERGEAGPSGWTPAHAGMIRGWRRELGGSRRLNVSPLPGCGWRWEYLTLGVIDAFGPDSRRPAVHATGEAPTALSAMLAADAALEVGRE